MRRDYDVIICGGGPGGIGAAIGAARSGAKVLLVERYGFLGGGATAMLVNPFMSFTAGDHQLVQGIFQEFLEALKAMGSYGAPRAPRAFDAEAFKVVAEELCIEAGVDLLYHAYLAGAEVENGHIEKIQVATKDGLKSLTAKIFVDSTGDGDLAFFAGAPIEKGRTEDGLSQPMTLNFRMAGVDLDAMPSREEFNAKYVEAKEKGLIQCPRENVLLFYSTQPDVIHFNQTRVICHDATCPISMTKAEIEGRRQAWQLSRWMIESIPGFEGAYLQQTAPQLGVRESRRVMGHHLLTAEELLSACKFQDVIACGNYSVDIHNPTGEGTIIKRVEPGKWYDIPYRSIVPLKIDNLLIGGRSISATHEAHSAIRIIPIVFAIGHGAGVAAAQASSLGVSPIELEPQAIQRELLEQGAFLG